MTAVSAQQINDIGYELSVHTDIGDDLAAISYFRLMDDGLLPVVFYHGVPELQWYLNWFRQKGAVIMGCFARPVGPMLDRGDKQLAGLGWILGINDIFGYRRGEIGMCFFKEWQVRRMPEEWAEQMLDVAFQKANMDTIYGTTPVPNRAAVRFSRRLGFHLNGPIPNYCSWGGKPVDAIISSLSKEEWFNGRRK